MKMLLIFITLGFYFNAWEKKKKKQSQVCKLLAIHCPLCAKAQKTNKQKKKPWLCRSQPTQGFWLQIFSILTHEL